MLTPPDGWTAGIVIQLRYTKWCDALRANAPSSPSNGPCWGSQSHGGASLQCLGVAVIASTGLHQESWT